MLIYQPFVKCNQADSSNCMEAFSRIFALAAHRRWIEQRFFCGLYAQRSASRPSDISGFAAALAKIDWYSDIHSRKVLGPNRSCL
jgi:hypothetical protein